MTAAGGQQRNGDEAAHSMVEAGPRPYVTPCVTRDEILKVFVKGRRVFQRALHVRVAQDATANGQPCLVCRIFHDVTPGRSNFRISESISLKAIAPRAVTSKRNRRADSICSIRAGGFQNPALLNLP